MKYTIELTNKQKAQMDCMMEIVHRYVGFNPKLEPVIEDTIITTGKELKELQDDTYYDAYNKGIEDLAHAIKVYFPLNSKERLEHFGINISTDNFAVTNPRRLIDSAKIYEEKKKAEEEIKVGDEVITLGENIAVVTKVEDNCVRVMFKDGTGFRDQHTIDGLKKTGRHFEEVEQLLDKLRGDDVVDD